MTASELSTKLSRTQVSIRAFFPVWVLLYVFQFVLMPVITGKYWYVALYMQIIP